MARQVQVEHLNMQIPKLELDTRISPIKWE